MSERDQLKELVEEHRSRGIAKDADVIGLVSGLAAISEVLAALQNGAALSPLVLQLRRAVADTKAALQCAGADPGLERVRAFADRQLAFAAVLEEELICLEEHESTLA